MNFRRKITFISTALLVIVMIVLAVAGLHGFYQDHIKRDCGADCGRTAPEIPTPGAD